MKTLLFIFFLAFNFIIQAWTQNKPGEILVTINKNEVTGNEFEHAFLKNQSDHSVNNETVNQYFDLFVKFRLKLLAAHDAGLDTLSSFNKEFKSYRDQLAKSYMTDSTAINKLLKEAYDRTINEVLASHIMIRVKSNPTPEDTLMAYKKIDSIRNCILAGESFESLASKFSDDKSAKINNGKLGYFSAFHVDYSFECAAYNLKPGEISLPVRTKFGYHIIKVWDFHRSEGQIKVAHIMIASPPNASEAVKKDAQAKINIIYEQLLRGDNFGELAIKYSEDKNTAKNKGELPWFNAGEMIPEFEEQAFAIQTPGSICAPFKSYFGWHIIKLIDKKAIPPFDQIEGELKKKILNDKERSASLERSFMKKLMKTYSFKEYKENLKCFYELDSSIQLGKFNIKSSDLKKPLIVIQDSVYTLEDYKNYLLSNRPNQSFKDINAYIDQYYKKFIDYEFLQFEDKNLDSKYPDFHNLVQEYHDGILLYDIMDREVWSKASHDTAGLRNFYNHMPKKYVWGERLKVTVFNCLDETIAEKIKSLIDKAGSQLPDYSQLVKEVCDSMSKPPVACFKIEHKYYSKGDNSLIDSLLWKPQISNPVKKDNQYVVVKVEEVLKPQPKKLEEVRGLVMVDYQNLIEENWIKDLKAKYSIVINKKVLQKLAVKYNKPN